MSLARDRVREDANRQQSRATAPDASVWVGASAGTGKTTVLVDRLLRLLLDGAAPHRILCLTYTKAAAAEMANRLALRLSDWATIPDPALEQQLEKLLGRAPAPGERRDARTLFATVLDTPGGMHIETIHAFCQAVLKRFPVEAGVAPHFEVLDERDGGELQRDAIREVVSHARRGDDTTLAEALSIVTGYVGEDDFAALMSGLVADRHRLTASLGEAPDAAVAGRIRELLGLPANEDIADVVAAFCSPGPEREASLREVSGAMIEGSATDRKRGAPIRAWLDLDETERPGAIDIYAGGFLTAKGEPFKSFLTKGTRSRVPDGEAVLAAECDRLLGCLARRNDHEVAAATAALLVLARHVADAYERGKRARAALDFNDLIHHVRALLTRNAGSAAWVLYKLDGGLDHLLVDEAQDTSPEQWELLAALVEEFFAGEGAREEDGSPRTLFVVGDVKQSIYSFQGAEPARFVEMREFFRRRVTDAGRRFESVDLHVTFRSTQAVLETVDRVFAADQPAADGVAIDGSAIRHEAERIAEHGRVEIWPIVAPDEEPEEEPWAPPVVQDGAAPPRQRLAAEIAQRIGDAVAGGEDRTWFRGAQRPLAYRDVMILVRRRGDKAGFVEEIVRALKNRNVPVAGVDRMFLTEQLAVMDLMALGDFLLLPEDDLTLATVLKGPLIGLDEDALFDLAHGRGRATLWQRLVERRDDPAFARAHVALAGWLARADFVPPYDLFAGILEGEGGRAALLGRLGVEAEDPVDEFLSLALAYERDHARSLQGFLHWLRAAETQVKRDLEQSPRDEVRVMTVHGSKGLEAPVVFLPDTRAVPDVRDRVLWPEDGGLPLWAPVRAMEGEEAGGRRAALLDRQQAEYRRLLYVAMTRARDRLIVCGWDTKTAAPKGNWYDLIVEALAADLEPESMTFPTGGFAGDGYVIEAGEPATEVEPPVEEEADMAPPDWLHAPPGPEPDPPAPLAPSRPSGDEPPVRAPFDADDTARFRRGRLIHTLLELLPALPEARWADAAHAYLARPIHELNGDQVDAYTRETLGILRDPSFAELFGPGSLAEVPLTGLIGRTVVSGQVDRLLVTDKRVLVVDYKTNRPPPERVEDVAAVYLRQMAAYRALLREIYPGRAVECALLWTDTPRTMALPDALLDAYAPDKMGESPLA